MATHSLNMEYIYEQGESKDLFVEHAQEAKIQGTGSGSFKVYGRLTRDGEAKPLTLINASTFEMTDTGKGNEIYICDVSGLRCIYANEVSGMSRIYARAFAST